MSDDRDKNRWGWDDILGVTLVAEVVGIVIQGVFAAIGGIFDA